MAEKTYDPCAYCGQAARSPIHDTDSEDIERRVASHSFVPITVTHLSMPLAVKLAALVVHADEATGPTGHVLDMGAMRGLAHDPEVRAYVERFDAALLPVKR
jgi:hypothetical protein